MDEPAAGAPHPLRVCAGALCVAGGLGALAAQGLHEPAGPAGLALWPVAAVVAGAAALGVLGRPAEGRA